MTETHASPLSSGHSRMHAPGSLTKRIAGDNRMTFLTTRVFVLQVAHPAVGAGVDRFSSFRTDPWTRFEHVVESQRKFLWRGEASARAEGERLRALHRSISGVDSSGRAFHALDPDVYGWVHDVFFEAMVTMRALYAEPLTSDEEQSLFVEWQEAARLLGISTHHIPPSLDSYWARWNNALENILERNAVVDDLLDRGKSTPPNPLPRLPNRAWRWAWKPIAMVSYELTMGSLPAAYRRKLEPQHVWTDRDQTRFERERRVVRRCFDHAPDFIRRSSDARADDATHSDSHSF